MSRARMSTVFRGIGLLAFLLSAFPVSAGEGAIVSWKVVGIISGQAQPFTTAAYFRRPLVPGEMVEMTFTINTSASALIYGSIASYQGAITSVKISGSDWAIRMRSPLSSELVITNDDPTYGDSLTLVANTVAPPGKTLYQVVTDMRNPGGPNPGVGPWAPFTSLALAKSPPPIGLFPSQVFYVGAHRNQAGQPLDGGVYYGYILSIVAAKHDD
jgi:hypothetical protein